MQKTPLMTRLRKAVRHSVGTPRMQRRMGLARGVQYIFLEDHFKHWNTRFAIALTRPYASKKGEHIMINDLAIDDAISDLTLADQKGRKLGWIGLAGRVGNMPAPLFWKPEGLIQKLRKTNLSGCIKGTTAYPQELFITAVQGKRGLPNAQRKYAERTGEPWADTLINHLIAVAKRSGVKRIYLVKPEYQPELQHSKDKDASARMFYQIRQKFKFKQLPSPRAFFGEEYANHPLYEAFYDPTKTSHPGKFWCINLDELTQKH